MIQTRPAFVSIFPELVPSNADAGEIHRTTCLIMCMFALANSASALYKGG